MNRLLLVLIIILSADLVFAQSPPPCTLTNVAFDQPTLQTLLNDNTMVHDGDVICLAAGTQTYTAGLDISKLGTKAIEIRGAGTMPLIGAAATGQTTIINHLTTGSNAIGFYEVSASVHNPIVSNINFVIDGGSNLGSIDIANAVNGGIGQPSIIHHNTFDMRNSAAASCSHIGISLVTSHGIVYRNKLLTDGTVPACSFGFTNLIFFDEFALIAKGINDKVLFWETPSTFGSADAPVGSDYSYQKNYYIETNEFNGGLVTDIKESSRGVVRFNTFKDGTLGSHGYDSGQTGARHAEIYNNTFLCDASTSGGHSIAMSNWISQRGGIVRTFSNSFPATDPSQCGFGGGTIPAFNTDYFRSHNCPGQPGWPGAYPLTYPGSHQPGWGYIAGATLVGSSTACPGCQDLPDNANFMPMGHDGYNQDLEPSYFANNVNNTTLPVATVNPSVNGGCRAMAYSNFGKSSGTTLVVPASPSVAVFPYVSLGEDAVFVFADLIGGSAPTISDNCNGGQTWTPLQGGTNGGMRLSAWIAHFNATCTVRVTITFGTSSAARAGTLIVIRGLLSSPLDKNPTVLTVNTSPYQGPATNTGGSPAQADEIVLGYFAIADATANSLPVTDAIIPTAPDAIAIACGIDVCAHYEAGLQGTTGGSDVSVAVTYRSVTSTTPIQPTVTDTNNPNGITGTVTFKVNGSAGATSPLDLQDSGVDGLIQSDREYYDQLSSNPVDPCGTSTFTGASGTGCGFRASRPIPCTAGTAWWATDQGSWNTSGSGGQGVLDKCIATNTWISGYEVPFTYPHPLADVIGGGVTCTPSKLAFVSQPTNTILGQTISTVAIAVQDSGGVTCTSATNAITISNHAGTCTGMTLSGTSSGNAVSGVFSSSNLSENAIGLCSLDATSSGLTTATSNTFTILTNADNLSYTIQPTSVISGNTFSPTILVQANLASGGVDTSFTNAVTLTISGCGASLTGTVTRNAVAGIATFSGLGAMTMGNNCTITATATWP